MALMPIRLDGAAVVTLNLLLRAGRRSRLRAGVAWDEQLVELEEALRAEPASAVVVLDAPLAPPRAVPASRAAAAQGPGDDVLLTQREAAQTLGRSPRTIRRWVDRGELEAVSTPNGRQIPQREVRLKLAETGAR